MKSFVLSLLLLFGVGVLGSGSAVAAVRDDAREAVRLDRGATYRDAGTHLNRQRIARASINDSDDYFERSNSWRSAKSKKSATTTTKKRYTVRKKATRTAKRPGKTRHYAKRGKAKHYAKRQRGKSVAARGTGRRTAAMRRTTPRSLSQDGPSGPDLFGVASYYWQPQRVAAGGWFDPNAMTAAHKTLPFGTRVRVTHLGNGRSVDVKINDRGPYIAGRIIDLSKAAAGVLGMHAQGIARVKVTVLGRS